LQKVLTPKLRLEIQPLPHSTWGISLAHKLPKYEWDYLRKKCYLAAGFRCEICFSDVEGLNAHELWRYDDTKCIQHFAGLECCCTLCHDVHHFGRSSIVYDLPRLELLVHHWCKVNRLRRKDFLGHRDTVAKVSLMRASKKYIVMVGKRILE